MPLKLSVGVSRKEGRPNFGSLGASCGIEVELDASLIWSDPDRFRRMAREAYAACDRVVQDQLRRDDPSPLRVAPETSSPPVPAVPRDPPAAPPDRPATPQQRRALSAMADRFGFDLSQAADELIGVADVQTMTARQASLLIGRLRAGSGGR